MWGQTCQGGPLTAADVRKNDDGSLTVWVRSDPVTMSFEPHEARWLITALQACVDAIAVLPADALAGQVFKVRAPEISPSGRPNIQPGEAPSKEMGEASGELPPPQKA